MCHISAMEEGIVRKRHERATRTSSTMTAEGSESTTSSIAEPVLMVQTRETAHPTPALPTMESGVHYMVNTVLPSPGKEPQRPKTRLQCRKDSWVYRDPNVFSDSDVDSLLRSEKYLVDAPRTGRPLAPARTSRSRRGSALHRHRAEGAALQLRRRLRPCQTVTPTRQTGRVFGIISNILALSSQSPSGPAGGAPNGYGLGRRAAGPGGGTTLPHRAAPSRYPGHDHSNVSSCSGTGTEEGLVTGGPKLIRNGWGRTYQTDFDHFHNTIQMRQLPR